MTFDGKDHCFSVVNEKNHGIQKQGFVALVVGRLESFHLKVSNFSMTGKPRSLLKLGMEKGV